MIARCPQCQTRYRIAREKIAPQGARIRCSGCQTIFRVQVPPEPPAAQAAVPQPPLARALVAEADASVAKAIAEHLLERRIAADIVENGAEALLQIYRKRPDLVVLGGHLPGVRSPAIAELLRRTAEFRDLPAIRVAPLDEPAGAPEFDASATLEPADLPAGLGPILARLGIGQAPVPARPAAPPAPPVPVAARPAPVPAAPAPPPATPRAVAPPAKSADPEVAKAERLARITISDIILYNERKFATAAASGKVAEALAHELEEARQHFNSRVAAEVRASRDFLIEELQRRAAQHRA